MINHIFSLLCCFFDKLQVFWAVKCELKLEMGFQVYKRVISLWLMGWASFGIDSTRFPLSLSAIGFRLFLSL